MKLNILSFILLAAGTMMSSFSAYALTAKEQKLMQQHGLGGPKIMLHADTWGVKPSKIDVDGYVFKGQSKSLIDWKMDYNKWLDFNYWKQQRQARDELPDWKIKLRESQHVESIGRVVKCHGVCQIFRERSDAHASYMSQLFEGDELKTSEDSYVWVALADGSLFRLSPKTSLTFNEINIGVKDIFYFIRLNHGHIHWQVRKSGKYEEQNLAETDQMFLPLMLKEANREYFARMEFAEMKEDQKLLYYTRKNPGHVFQYKKLNELLEEKKEVLNRKNIQILMVTANSTYLVKNAHFDLFYATNGQSKFRYQNNIDGFKSDDSRETKVTAFLRGYNNREEKELSHKQWYLVSRDGKTMREEDFTQQFKTIDLFVKRIPSILMAREIIIRKNFKHLLEEKDSDEKLATVFGYRLWDKDGKEFEQRMAFLKEYTRRVETTNITSMAKVFKDAKAEDFDRTYYKTAINLHMKRLKGLYNKAQEVVPELNELQYYIWILKYAKK